MYEYRATVRRVIDGDSISLNVDIGFDTWHVGSFRLLGVAARELKAPGGPEARTRLQELLPVGTEVYVESVKPDKFSGRYLAKVWLRPSGVDVGARLIDEGWAVRWNGRGAQPVPPWPREQVPT